MNTMKNIVTRAALTCTTSLFIACTPGVNNHPGTAEIESTGMRAIQAQHPDSIKTLRVWANQGIVTAQRELGLALAVQQDKQAEAAQWMEKAAKAGDTEAQFAFAEANYKAKLGLPQNLTVAWKWYEVAATKNNAKASFMLARMAKYGEGRPLDLQKSVHWLKVASDQGNAQAMFLLSNAYTDGDGIAKDPVQARTWLERSAEGDFPPAIQALAMELEGDKKHHDPDKLSARHLLKEASDERMLRWNKFQ